MKRTPKTQKAYEKYLKNIKEKGITPFSENEVINFGTYKNKLKWRLVKNKFPYKGYSPEEHMLIIMACDDDSLIDEYIEIVKSPKDVFYMSYNIFENEKKDRSVNEFRHLHIMSKNPEPEIESELLGEEMIKAMTESLNNK